MSEDARGKRDIAIVFRGTQTGNELLTDVTAFMTAWDQETQKGVTAGARKRMRSGVYVEQVRGCPAEICGCPKECCLHATDLTHFCYP